MRRRMVLNASDNGAGFAPCKMLAQSRKLADAERTWREQIERAIGMEREAQVRRVHAHLELA